MELMFGQEFDIMCLCLELMCLIFVCIHEYQYFVVGIFQVLDEVLHIYQGLPVRT
jgi:hypothetical protein